LTTFIVFAAVMVVMALLLTTWPLWRDKEGTASRRLVPAISIILLVPLASGLLYAQLTNWDWGKGAERVATVEQMLSKLESHLKEHPDDSKGWEMMGRSYVALGRNALAIDAYQKAYDLTKGESIEASIGLAEALVMTDEASLKGRAGQLVEAVLSRAPQLPKALWFGAFSAIERGDLKLGRERLQMLSAQNPPEQLRAVIAQQIQEINSQLGESQPGQPGGPNPAAPIAPAATTGRAVKVAVTIDPKIKAKLTGDASLFVLARDPSGGGPPLAVQRHSASELPLNVELSERDAMIASRSIATVPNVELVARISLSGTPQAKSGDFFGSVTYSFDKDSGPAKITIDQVVP
jgi:cytochrome c-type biogenesis protein CcmH